MIILSILLLAAGIYNFTYSTRRKLLDKDLDSETRDYITITGLESILFVLFGVAGLITQLMN